MRVRIRWTSPLSQIPEPLPMQSLPHTHTPFVFNHLLPLSTSHFWSATPSLSIYLFYLLFYVFSFTLIFLLIFSLQKLKRLGLDKNRLITRCTSGSDEFGSVNGLQLTPNKLFVQEVSLFYLLIFFYLSFKCSNSCYRFFPNVLHSTKFKAFPFYWSYFVCAPPISCNLIGTVNWVM